MYASSRQLPPLRPSNSTEDCIPSQLIQRLPFYIDPVFLDRVVQLGSDLARGCVFHVSEAQALTCRNAMLALRYSTHICSSTHARAADGVRAIFQMQRTPEVARTLWRFHKPRGAPNANNGPHPDANKDHHYNDGATVQ
jgi:hypothetical protein